MSPHKRTKLHNKRTPWIKSRYSRKARAIQAVMRAQILSMANHHGSMIASSARRQGKASALKQLCSDNMRAVSNVPLYGSKTQ